MSVQIKIILIQNGEEQYSRIGKLYTKDPSAGVHVIKTAIEQLVKQKIITEVK